MKLNFNTIFSVIRKQILFKIIMAYIFIVIVTTAIYLIFRNKQEGLDTGSGILVSDAVTDEASGAVTDEVTFRKNLNTAIERVNTFGTNFKGTISQLADIVDDINKNAETADSVDISSTIVLPSTTNTTDTYTYGGEGFSVKEGFNAPSFKGVADALDPRQNGVADSLNPDTNGIGAAFRNTFDPKLNGILHTLNPETNGVSPFFSDLGNQIYTQNSDIFNNTVDNASNIFILLGYFFKKTVPDFFVEFLGEYWNCFVKMLFNLKICIFFYLLTTIGELLYIIPRLIVWIFCLEYYEKMLWDAIYALDEATACTTGVHFAKFPKWVIDDCYTCDIKTKEPELPNGPIMKTTKTQPMFGEKGYIGRSADAKLNPANNGVAHALNPATNGVKKTWENAFDPDNPKSVLNAPKHMGNSIAAASIAFGEDFTELFEEIGKEIAKTFVDFWDNKLKPTVDTAKNTTEGIYNDAKTAVIGGIDTIKETATDVIDNVKDGAVNIFDDVKGEVVGAFSRVGYAIEDEFKNIGDEIVNAFKTVIKQMTNIFR